jgi:MOSC domain-containing protein YiiM
MLPGPDWQGMDRATCRCTEDQTKPSTSIPKRITATGGRIWASPPMPYGGFGENFTVSSLTEDTVCIGDVFRVGNTVIVQVSEPRGPCWKLARRLDVKDIVVRVNQTGFSGWYFRVLQEGAVSAGMDLILIERSYPEWTVTSANQARWDALDIVDVRRLAECPALAESWRKGLRKRLESRS